MVVFTREECQHLVDFVIRFREWIAEDVNRHVHRLIGVSPQPLQDILRELREIRSTVEAITEDPIEVRPEALPLVKRTILHTRQEKAFEKEAREQRTLNRELRETLDDQFSLITEFTKHEWFKETVAARCPKLTDFLTIQQAERVLKMHGSVGLQERDYDEKFDILIAPALFLPDLSYFRAVCSLRGLPVSVAYLDIDDFKAFNTCYGEPRVDRDVLPQFMSALEAHLFFHGHAYRYGGDEYVVLLPNMAIGDAVTVLAAFQKKLQHLSFFDIDKRIQVSIGICEVTDESVMTDREVEQAANSAKAFAKDSGKNRIAVVVDAGSSVATYEIRSIEGG